MNELFTPQAIRKMLMSLIAGCAVAVFFSTETAFKTIFVSAAVLIVCKFIGRQVLVMSVLLVLFLIGAVRAHYLENGSLPSGDFYAQVIADTVATEYGSSTPVKFGNSKIKVYGPRYPEFRYGDQVLVTLKNPDSAKPYQVGSLALVSSQKDGPSGFLMSVRRLFIKGVLNSLPEPHATFVAGTVVGGSAGLPKDVREDFVKTGISHILAASGYNFTLLLLFVGYLLRPLSFRLQIILSLLFVPGFALIAGASPPVIRAGLMGSLALCAVIFGRISSAKSALLWAAALMLFINPELLKQDLGWQLSFASTAGLVYLSPVFEKYFNLDLLFEKENLFNQVKTAGLSALMVTLAAYIATFPLVAFSFGRVSTVALAVNVLVSAFIPLIMVSGIAAGILGLILPIAGQVAAIPGWLATEYVFKVSGYFSDLSFAQLQTSMTLPGLVFAYACIVATTFLVRSRLVYHRHWKI